MLQDIPYKTLLDKGRKYDVWRLRDLYGNTFADIAREYGVSVVTITHDYNLLLLFKIRYYVNHLSLVYGYQTTAHFSEIWKNALDCYSAMKYVAAYFEKEYADILKEYRQGEPGMPEQLLRELPPLRNKFSKQTVASVIRLKETKGMTFPAIGKRLRMTREKAQDLYSGYYHRLFYQLSGKLIEITGDKNLRDRYQDSFPSGSSKKSYDRLLRDYPELCAGLLKGKKRG